MRRCASRPAAAPSPPPPVGADRRDAGGHDRRLGALIGAIAALFALDLFVSRAGHAHAVGLREAAPASVFYIAVAFGVVFGLIAGWDFGSQYFAGYIVEKSLSVDNLLVFVVILATFSVAPERQQRVLTFGILVALVLRAIFIAVGAVLLSLFSLMFAVFGECAGSTEMSVRVPSGAISSTARPCARMAASDPSKPTTKRVREVRRVGAAASPYCGRRHRSMPNPWLSAKS